MKYAFVNMCSFCDTELVWLTENQVHGLDKEEAEFLDFVHDRQQEIEKERQLEEMSALQELHVFFMSI